MGSQSMSVFKVACLQNCAANDMAANLSQIERLARAAVDAGAELVLAPEFYCVLEPSDGDYFANGFSAEEHPAIDHAKQLVADLGVWMVLGSIPVRHTAGKVHNRCLVINPNQEIVATYDKIHLFDVAIKDGQEYRESSSVQPGERAAIAELPWGKLGLSICYDIRFPHLYRSLGQAGADFISVPAAFTAKTGAAHWHTLVRARAIETGCYVFAPGQCGQRPWGRRTYGHSLIVSPWGEVLADAGEDEGFVVAEIDPQEVIKARRMIPALSHDRPISGPD